MMAADATLKLHLSSPEKQMKRLNAVKCKSSLAVAAEATELYANAESSGIISK